AVRRPPPVRYLGGGARLAVPMGGAPYDGGTSSRPGARHGPRHIRDQSSLIRPFNPVLGVAPFERLRVADYGDVDVSPVSIEETFAAVERDLDEIVAGGATPLGGGGGRA